MNTQKYTQNKFVGILTVYEVKKNGYIIKPYMDIPIGSHKTVKSLFLDLIKRLKNETR